MSEVEGEIRDEELDAEREVRRQLALAQVRQYPDPVLRMRAHEVDAFDEPLAELVERMGKLMQEARGVGLAAPQVGILQRVFVYQVAEDAPVRALVNPRIVETGEAREAADEGCLSLGAATVTAPVERPTRVSVVAQAPDGKELALEADALEARVIQHELDHLDGILILDRTDAEHRRRALAELRPQPALR